MRTIRRTVVALLFILPLAPGGWGGDGSHAIAGAQERVVEQHDWSDPEGRIMGFYSAALAFSPVGIEAGGAPWSGVLGLELSLIPPLSGEHRSAGGAKTQSTNLAPLLPRPRLAVVLPGRLLMELSWVPPVRAFDVTANLWAASLSLPIAEFRSVTVAPRIAGAGGTVTGAITCNDDLRSNGGGDSLYFNYICHDRESRDRFEPTAVSGELIGYRRLGERRLTPYAGLGVRREWNRFVVGVFNFDGTPDPNHAILEMDVTRAYGFAGVSWTLPRSTVLSGELFYAPGSLLTLRLQGGLRFGSWNNMAGAAH
ncbi:MAG: hypothetical protein ACRENI_10950 [Gemmatimonadaceae bacterium]